MMSVMSSAGRISKGPTRTPGCSVSSAVDPLLAQKAAQWRHLNIVRVLVFLAVNLAMLSPIRQVHRMLVAATSTTRDRGAP